ncbi:hypothetical protein PsorP6_012886 [Peronosclerospora sorghi]|uniref:Uncharacterized protein n=1 Tax=Peronosclerospora sorghi TaxID=230839 RepID=A0ACC0WI25_9STRA|nr:hypothetical protein PsorP6_012886 [Peronosclerospora sorghi]
MALFFGYFAAFYVLNEMARMYSFAHSSIATVGAFLHLAFRFDFLFSVVMLVPPVPLLLLSALLFLNIVRMHMMYSKGFSDVVSASSQYAFSLAAVLGGVGGVGCGWLFHLFTTFESTAGFLSYVTTFDLLRGKVGTGVVTYAFYLAAVCGSMCAGGVTYCIVRRLTIVVGGLTSVVGGLTSVVGMLCVSYVPSSANYVVLYEADRMIDMGFEPQLVAVFENMGSMLKSENENDGETTDVGQWRERRDQATPPFPCDHHILSAHSVPVPRSRKEKVVDGAEIIMFENIKKECDAVAKFLTSEGFRSYHTKLKVIVLDTDFGPASKVLGTLLVEHDSDTIIVYGDDDRHYPPQLSERVLYYTHKYPNDAIAVLGGWISAEDRFYCGRSLAVGLNSVSFVGGAGGVAVKRKFYGLGKATLPVFQVANMSKACFLEMITIYLIY